jgi:hypothetical protein
MATGRNKLPDFFNEDGIDPVESATGKRQPFSEDNDTSSGKDVKTGISAKKKAGFYLSKEILERFSLPCWNWRWHLPWMIWIKAQRVGCCKDCAVDNSNDRFMLLLGLLPLRPVIVTSQASFGA